MDDMTEVVLSYMEELDCARSLTVAILWRHREWVQLAKMRADPLHYRHPGTYFDAVRASDFVRKSPSLPTGIDREAEAKRKWYQAEHANAKTNARFLNYLEGYYPDCDPRIVTFCDDVKKEIRSLLGRMPAYVAPRFGPGATISDKSRTTTIPDKIDSHPTVTNSARFILPLWRETAWGRAHHGLPSYHPKTVRGNSFFTVPKDGETDRACAKGPSLNVAYQLGISQEMLRPRLLHRWGIDLDNAKELHMRVACSASSTGAFATIDLSNASDMIARNVVKFLLPMDWFDLLDGLREGFTLIDERFVHLEKFSAMGNGFTFELETIIFAAIARVACREHDYDVLVNGDDIIVPTQYASDVVAALRWFGFVPNPRKTFVQGPFRESCGGDYWLGQAVRPFLIDKVFPSEPQHWISIANGLRRVAPALRKPWFKTLDRIPSQVRGCRGPRELGDLVIHDDIEHWQTRTMHSIRYVRTYSPAEFLKVRWNGFTYGAQLAAITYGALLYPQPRLGKSWDEKDRYLIPRDGVSGYALSWVPFS